MLLNLGELGLHADKYSSLFEESKDVIFFSTVEGEFIDINPAGVQLFGLSSKDEMIRMKIDESVQKGSLLTWKLLAFGKER